MPRTDPLQNLRTYLAGLDGKVRQRGDTYARQGRVHRLKVSPDGTTISASVHGTHIYNTSLIFHDDGWSSGCDCPLGADCKHAAALSIKVLGDKSLGDLMPLPASQDGEDDDIRPRMFPGGFPATLLPWEKKRAKALEAAYAHYLKNPAPIDTPTLESLFGHWPGLDNEEGSHDIFPDQRLEPVQFWHFLLAFARDRGVERIPDFGPLNDLTPTLPLIQAKRKEAHVARWHRVFQGVKSNRPTTPAAPVRFRLRLLSEEGRIHPEVYHDKKGRYVKLADTRVSRIVGDLKQTIPMRPIDALILRYLDMQAGSPLSSGIRSSMNPDQAAVLAHILRFPTDPDPAVINANEAPLRFSDTPLQWQWSAPGDATASRSHTLGLVRPDGTPVTGKTTIIPSHPPLCISGIEIHPCPPFFEFSNPVQLPLSIPEEALVSNEGIEAVLEHGCGMPPALSHRVRTLQPSLAVQLRLIRRHGQEYLHLAFAAKTKGDPQPVVTWNRLTGWKAVLPPSSRTKKTRLITDLRRLHEGSEWLESWDDWGSVATQEWQRPVGKSFAEQFIAWADRRPAHVIVDADSELVSLLEPASAGIWKVTLEPKGVDWFDLSVRLTLDDTTLTAEETRALLEAKGALVRLPGRGWRRMSMDADPEILAHVRESGIDPTQSTGTRHRLHALQVASSPLVKSAPADLARRILERAAEIENTPAPALPTAIGATLRPYQTEGYHFLCRMSRAGLGGVLGDDMGLGKTVQALSWLAWLRETEGADRPTLVVCPKSVMDVWMAEAARFYPTLPLVRGGLPGSFKGPAPLVVLNYAQLRNLRSKLEPVLWQAVLLDEGQYIKNPDSQSAKAASALKTAHRLVLSGTPIENRLLDLWSLMHFAMPGVLGTRAGFTRHYNEKKNPQARSLLSRRVRPFLIRRTKGQVARDLPERIEEDIPCTLEGAQLDLYNGHLKEARSILLDLKTTRDLDRARFNILTSLLRLRQACCHPQLLAKGKVSNAPSAKLDALLDVLDPLLQEGHKVLIFSQFVEMLHILRPSLIGAGWPLYYLDGSTENRKQVVQDFQSHEGSAAFLISLKAGGAGLNLTAASYVVLFDPWWNPAVEAQAIDRTHRIGQDKTVIAYRLIAKNTIEEKIRQLQKAKARLFQDVLGEENFAKALSLDDFRFLLGDTA